MVVADILQHWLRQARYGPISLGSTASRSAVKALVDGWSTNLVRALAARPLALAELNRFISISSYPTLERRLGAMNQAGLVEPHRTDEGRGTPTRSPTGSAAPSPPHRRRRLGAPPRARPRRPDRPQRRGGHLPSRHPQLELSPEVNGRARLSVELRSSRETEICRRLRQRPRRPSHILRLPFGRRSRCLGKRNAPGLVALGESRRQGRRGGRRRFRARRTDSPRASTARWSRPTRPDLPFRA